jgi:DNA-binding MarR family transcriptional regulator
MSPHELADGAGVTRATVTGLLDGLERDGFVSRRAGKEDRRKIIVKLSAKGRAEAAQLFKTHTDWIDSLFAGLGPADRARLRTLLGKIWQGTDAGRTAGQESTQ